MFARLLRRREVLLFAAVAIPARAQTPITRDQAIARALTRSPQLALSAADTSAASAEVRAARAFPNPTISLGYSGAVPRLQALLNVPIDAPWIRDPRTRAADLADTSARLRFAFERASFAFDVDTIYTRVLAARSLAALSSRSAAASDTLVQLARTRRDAGDASDLEVELATVSAGTQHGLAADDSLGAVHALLDLQLLLGLSAERVELAPADSLTVPSAEGDGDLGTPLPVAAAQATLASERQRVDLERRTTIGAPTLTGGVEGNDPTGVENGPLAVLGISWPLPIFNQNGAGVARATADVERASAQLDVVQMGTTRAIARAHRELEFARQRVRRDQETLASANRVSAMSVTAYREGAATLPSVIEAQRSAREQLARYIGDLAAAANASASVRLLTLSVPR